jgi:hypothetical protein
MNDKKNTKIAPEIAAIGAVHAALAPLEPAAQTRVLNYVARILKIGPPTQEEGFLERAEERIREESAEASKTDQSAQEAEPTEEEIEGVSPVAKKWMARNGLTTNQLSAIFSLGVDEIDLIAKTVPGKSQRDKVRSVVLLKGIAAYLGTGAARFTHEQLKETCLHYDAYDATNFSKYLKSLSSEVAGNKSSSYTLTARGLANATEVIKAMTQPKGSS